MRLVWLGNVAHDLRTPLQAFLSELEYLHDKTAESKCEQTENIKCSIKQLERISIFMNMTINRSIDFTKVSTGIKLTPSIESTNFAETLDWAVDCMMNSHTSVPIVISSISEHLTNNQIYTDKQWLLENLLCLLSNSQKFTTEGEISIRCSLQVEPKPLASPAATTAAQSVDELTSFGDIEKGDVSRSFTEQPASMLRIEVEDTGIGISHENQEKLFKPLIQV